MAQQTAVPRHRRTTLVAVALLLVVLAVGAVTAVRLFPTSASGQAGAETTSLIEFRAGERASLTQAGDEATSLIEFRAGERASLRQAGDEATSLIEFRAGERASLRQAGDETKHGPPGR
jgi:hypothetical protein